MKKTMIAAMLLTAMAGASAQSIYTKAGLLGVGVGYAHGINTSSTVRVDYSTIGSISRTGTSGDFDYEGKIKFNQTGLYGDWFPFSGAFRFTGGLMARQAELSAEARPNQQGEITIGDATVGFGQNDSVKASIKFPTTSPYIGIGWGHNVSAQSKGFSVFADLGVIIGKPKVKLEVSDSLKGKITQAGKDADEEIAKQTASWKDDADKIKVMPQFYVGVSYKF